MSEKCVTKLLYLLPMERMTNKAIERNGVLYFKCKKCGEVKPLNSAHFHRNTTAMMGYNSKCVECVRKEMTSIYKPVKRYITKAELVEENKELKVENKKLKNMINTTIGIAYDKDDFDAIEYLVHERDGSEIFTLQDIKDGKTKRKRNHND